ncbi:type II toxin-antitoxin system VapC family toxin [Qingshengfaniella alkalisoli]|uniref:Ribonuclease VapC n=1 Tax=Qingshengfaniella alkalisoli TaxID=2599296 RepID=A0A5B8J1T4_9RHOB|nr:type II toxin-antitoxin system VapC family toxin [Qingshengfaniella alkalisoli]QDY71131.1 type II toxin-antitoxin system VapC family toxin [Qingshengfaniella alkalisoli]
MFILDTNVISALRRPERAQPVVAWLQRQAEDDLFLSAVTIGEIARGIDQQSRVNPDFASDLQQWLDRTCQLFSDRILPFDSDAALIWGRLSAQIGHDGADLMIAATAIAHQATVATRNVKDFLPTGVALLNPFE